MFNAKSHPGSLPPKPSRSKMLWTAAALVALCSQAGAATESPAMSACRSAFVSHLTTAGSAAADFRVTFLNNGYVATEAQYHAGERTYDLLARDARTGAPVATTTCNVDETGSVVATLDQRLPRDPEVASR